MTSALCGGDDTATPWRSSAPFGLSGKRITECCNSRQDINETEYQTCTAYEGYVAGIRWRCAPGHGCNVRPGLKRTAHLRHYEGGDE